MAAPTLLDPEGAGRLPADIELATGLGKTSLIALWALAPSRALARKSSVVPRRLAYVVDRRVVVDQASEFAEQVRERLEQAIPSGSREGDRRLDDRRGPGARPRDTHWPCRTPRRSTWIDALTAKRYGGGSSASASSE
jgi:hypothetical protein